MSRHLNYTHAIVCRICDSLESACQNKKGEIDLAEARKQHEEYVKALRDIGLDVIELPPDESFPDSVFVEDAAVICNGQALITHPGHPSRAGEVNAIRNAIKKELELPIIEISDSNAKLDGGDVLFTGREFFVGISSRTNQAGALAVANAFPDYPVTPIKVNSPSILHLKECMTMGGPDIIIVSQDKDAQDIVKRVAREATHTYSTITVPDGCVANCLYANGTLIHLAGYPDSSKQLDEKLPCSKVALKFSDISKASGSLSCCSILVRKSKLIRKI